MIARHAAVALLALALVAVAGGARAQPAAPPILAPAEATAARAHFEKGVTLVDQRRYPEALAEFSAGYELSGRPLFLFNMGECARLGARPDAARSYYQRYLAAEPTGGFATTARSRLAELGTAAADDPTPTDPPPTPRLPTPAEAARARQPIVAGPVVLGAARPDPMPTSGRRWRWPILAGVGAAVVAGGVTAYVLTRDDGVDCAGACTLVDLR